MQTDKDLVTKAKEIQKYLTCVLLQDTCLFRFLPAIEDKLFGRYAPVWEYVRENGTGYQPDLIDIALKC